MVVLSGLLVMVVMVSTITHNMYLTGACRCLPTGDYLCLYILPIRSGKLGHGDINRVYRPKIVEQLTDMYIKKVVAGNQSSYAVTATGQV